MTFDLISGLHMQIQTWHPSLRRCIHAKYYVKSGLTNVLKNANKTKNMHLFSIWIANYSIIFNIVFFNYCSQIAILDNLKNFCNQQYCFVSPRRSYLEVIKLFSNSTQLSTKFILLIKVKMPTVVGILTFSRINTTSERLKARHFYICRY